MQATVNSLILHGKSIGLVPTMGALHEGHLSLVRRARAENIVTVVSIFVNPVQFGPSEDFRKYPRDIEGDTEKLLKEGVDILFTPVISSMYPENFLTHVEVEKLSEKLCGAFRPGHFRGVATIVTKLFHIIKPARAYFRPKGFSADSRHKTNGQRPRYGYRSCRLSYNTRTGWARYEFEKYLS